MFIRQYCPIRCGIRLTLHLLCSGFFYKGWYSGVELTVVLSPQGGYLACEVLLCQVATTLPNEPLVEEQGIPSGAQTQSNLATQSASLFGQSNLLCTR
jgi:hypothetical protein